MKQVRSWILGVGQWIQIEVQNEKRKLLKESIWAHDLHKSSDAIFPSIVTLVDLDCWYNKKKIVALLRLEDHAHSRDKGLDKFKDHFVHVLETSCKEVTHMDDDAFLGRHVVFEAILAHPCALDFLAQAQRIEFEKFQYLVRLCLLYVRAILFLHKESWLEPMWKD